MSGVHTHLVETAHAYTRSSVPWTAEENREASGRTSQGKVFGWKLFHYLSGGGMRSFGRTVAQDEHDRRQNRFLIAALVFFALWLVLLVVPCSAASLLFVGATFLSPCSAAETAYRQGGALVPFLAVTGKPTEADVVRKVEALNRDGYRSILVYPRYGLDYEYMGEEWLRMMEQFCREAKRRGMKVWLYDEYGFPSGSCASRVTTEPGAPDARRLTEEGIFRNDDGTFRREKHLSDKEVGNVFDRETVKRFVELTHEVYGRRLKAYFEDKTILGIFTDEPGTPLAPPWKREPLVRYAVWDGFRDEYRAETGGRDFDVDVEAFLRDETKADVWKHYSAVKGRRFRDVFYGTVNDWCRRMGIRSTGHLTEELCMVGGPLIQGDLLHVLKGEMLPGMDEIFTQTGVRDAEWITLSVAQHAIARGAGGGIVELFALGPNDMSAARMRQMIWLTALHGVDTYLVSMEVMDHRGLFPKHSYVSPVQEGQPWHKDLRVLTAEADRAARFARKRPRCEIAVRYPQSDAAVDTYRVARGVFAWNTLKGPLLRPLLAEFRSRQLDVDLIEETEKTDRRFVFRVERDGYVEERSGKRFSKPFVAADSMLACIKSPVRAYEKDGTVADDLVARCYEDGSAAFLNIRPNADRDLLIERDGVRTPVRIPARGVFTLEAGERLAAPAAAKTVPVDVPSWDISFAGVNLHRLVLDGRGTARFSVCGAKNLRLVLRSVPEATYRLDGRTVLPSAECTSLPVEFRPLYREASIGRISAGEHVLEMVGGKAESNFFLPQAFVAGRFAERGSALAAPCARGTVGGLDTLGLGSYVGDVVYTARVTAPEGDSVALALPASEAFVRAKWNGQDLGVRAWAPYEWTLPKGAREGTLEISVSTAVVNMLGDPRAARYDALRGFPRDRWPSEGLSVTPVWKTGSAR